MTSRRGKGESVMSYSLVRISLSAIVLAFLALGCNQGDERLEEKARIEGKALAQAELQAQVDNMGKKIEIAKAEGRAQAETGIDASNANLSAKAQLMEADLATRHLFYQALKGTYDGSLTTEQGEFKIRITLVPSLPPVAFNRTRQLEEIAADLNNLFFHAQVLQWNPASPQNAVGCRSENVKPDLVQGEISIASLNCPNLYQLRIFDAAFASSITEQESIETARAIREGKITKLSEIRGEVHPTTNAAIYTLSVKRSSAR